VCTIIFLNQMMALRESLFVQEWITISERNKKEDFMGKMIGLWLLGVPIIIIILLKVFGII
jgi:hypothetical protein